MPIDHEEAKDQFEDTPEGWAKLWQVEVTAAKDSVKKWHKKAKKIIKRVVDERESEETDDKRVNLYPADVETLQSILMGQIPKVTASRRFADAQDDEGRVAAESLERMLNTDIEKGSDSFISSMEDALWDWIVPGLGVARLRYVAEFGKRKVEPKVDPATGAALAPGYEEEYKTYENVEVDYINWEDFLWSPCRTWNENRWVAFGVDLSRKQGLKRFGNIFKLVPLNSRKGRKEDENLKSDPWGRARVWEIWDKETKQVFWYVEGFHKILDKKRDPYELDNFWPMAKPLIANRTTSKLMPTPGFILSQDLYNGVDELYARICLLEEALKVCGLYDKNAGDVAALLNSNTRENKLIPCDNWAMYGDKGGMRGIIDWFPLDVVAGAIDKLTQKMNDKMTLLQQVNGMADIMRGAAMQSATATESSIKAKMSSIRGQRKQDEIARFASETQAIRAEMIGKLFDPQTIVERSNIMRTHDSHLAKKAVELIKNEYNCYRIEVKPEQIAMQDYAALKGERTEFLQAFSTFLSAAAPMVQAMPEATPFMLNMVQWAMAGFKGSAQIEGVIDQAITQAQQSIAQKAANPQPPPPDPKLEAAKVKGEMEMQKIQATTQADLTKISAETQAEVAKQSAQMMYNLQEEREKAKIKALADVQKLRRGDLT